MTIQERLSGDTESRGHFQKERGLDENFVRRNSPTSRTSMEPWNRDLGSWMRQSPQICCAFHCHASIRSETGSSSVENNCDISFPQAHRALRKKPASLRTAFCGQARAYTANLFRRKVAHRLVEVQDQSCRLTGAGRSPGSDRITV